MFAHLFARAGMTELLALDDRLTCQGSTEPPALGSRVICPAGPTEQPGPALAGRATCPAWLGQQSNRLAERTALGPKSDMPWAKDQPALGQQSDLSRATCSLHTPAADPTRVVPIAPLEWVKTP